jgi:hypothetical protein
MSHKTFITPANTNWQHLKGTIKMFLLSNGGSNAKVVRSEIVGHPGAWLREIEISYQVAA